VPIRVLVAEDNYLVREAVTRLLETADDIEVVGSCEDLDSLLAFVADHEPDVVVTDIRMPPTNTDEGLRAAAEITRLHPRVAILVLSQYVEAKAAAALLEGHEAGVGYLLKERVTDLDEFVQAARDIAAGACIIDPLISEQLMAKRRRNDPVEALTERERDVLRLMAQGCSNKAIVKRLILSPKTVETHVRSIFIKLGLLEDVDGNRRVQAVVRWLESTS